jgi:hypothetical protein
MWNMGMDAGWTALSSFLTIFGGLCGGHLGGRRRREATERNRYFCMKSRKEEEEEGE